MQQGSSTRPAPRREYPNAGRGTFRGRPRKRNTARRHGVSRCLAHRRGRERPVPAVAARIFLAGRPAVLGEDGAQVASPAAPRPKAAAVRPRWEPLGSLLGSGRDQGLAAAGSLGRIPNTAASTVWIIAYPRSHCTIVKLDQAGSPSNWATKSVIVCGTRCCSSRAPCRRQ